MTKSDTTTSFRFDDDFIELLNTWSFMTKKEKGALLQDAFREYAQLEHNSDVAQKVNTIMEIMKED
ncbi:hypothetical protein [Paenibacillus sp. RC84]|uniref:hypothetical protein n=1 Tax=Paenibacillus sp. RC84 TaxID=3156252 RepID=UPI00351937D4